MIEQYLISHIEHCFEQAELGISKITSEINDIEGMTGQMTRHFYNNLLSIEGIKYLEIGCWQGSSSCSALYGNKAKAVLIDDFSGFGSPKEICLSNIEKFKGKNDVEFIESDCFKLDISKIKTRFNVYLFDGDHSEASQYKALEYYLPLMEDLFIFIADDWNWQTVRNGTHRAINELNLDVVFQKEFRTSGNDQFPPHNIADDTWWNGTAVFLFKKQN